MNVRARLPAPRALAWLCFTAALGCVEELPVETTSESVETTSAPVDVLPDGVTLTHSGPNLWQIDYRLDEPVLAIMLGPPTPEYHEQAWTLPPQFHVTIDVSGYALLERRNGRSFRTLSVQVQTWSEPVLYAPQPFAVFEQGTAINTGPLGYFAIGEDGLPRAFEPPFTFRPLTEETVVLPGLPNGELESLPLPNEGVFAYFGAPDDVTEGLGVRLLLDRDAPDGLESFLVEAAEAYASEFDAQLRPVLEEPLFILLPWEDAPGFWAAGNAQGGQIVGLLGGPATLDDDDLNRIGSFIAHEMAHVWQTRLGNDDARWYTEGSAELMALRTRIAVGDDSPATVSSILTDRVNPALAELEHTSLQDAPFRGYPELPYTAGMLLMAAAEAATGADGLPDDIFAIDRALAEISTGVRTDEPVAAFGEALVALGATLEAGEAIADFVETQPEDPELALETLFDATGLDYRYDAGRLVVE